MQGTVLVLGDIMSPVGGAQASRLPRLSRTPARPHVLRAQAQAQAAHVMSADRPCQLPQLNNTTKRQDDHHRGTHRYPYLRPGAC